MVKLHEVVSASVRLGLAAMVVALAACEPTPKYPVPEQPVVGEILGEQSGVVAADGQSVVIDAGLARLSVPAGAYPAGTRVTLRLVGNMRMQPEADSSLWGYPQYPVQAAQILPAQPPPAQALEVVFHGGEQSVYFAVFHATEGDSAWTGTGMVVLNTGAGLPFAASAPGLWTAGPAPYGSTGGSLC
jgi:hypothetical protein